MPVVSAEKLSELQQSAQGIRNICILAHVDHGKTSLTDGLIATNGIISPKLAGKIRYLDSRPDEQLRGITMEASAISLYFSLLRRPDPTSEPVQSEYLINLIDSPGHIDFSSEVSTASRLCDGAIVLVDAVEGVCSQTITVLRQTWTEKLKPLLVINKMDRLITELKLSPQEAYTHLKKLLEQVNAVMGSFYQGDRMESDLQWREKMDARVAASNQLATGHDDTNAKSESTGPTTDDYVDRDDDDLYFDPDNNNVIFSSAIDGWAFTPRQFARMYESKLGIRRQVLEKVLWGDYYLEPKTKRVLGPKHLKGRNLKPMFVQLVLDNIWAVYDATLGSINGTNDITRLEKITTSLNITIPTYVMRSKEPRAILTSVFSSWLPLSTALLVSVTESLPSPLEAQEARMPSLLQASPGSAHISSTIIEVMTKPGKRPDEPVVAYVSKMVAVPVSDLSSSRRKGATLTADEAQALARQKRAEIARARSAAEDTANDTNLITDAIAQTTIASEDQRDLNARADSQATTAADDETLIGFARVFSGTLHVGDELYVLSPRHSPDPAHHCPPPTKIRINALYLLMGRSLEPLASAPAGAIVGIGGLENSILKTGTLCSACEGAPNLSSTGSISTNAPIVRVALEPVWPADLDKMVAGLRKLEQADPAVVYERLQSGEHVIVTAGEIHLERCLKDLRERFARCEIQSGEAIVPYRETIVGQIEMNAPRDTALGRGRVEILTASKQIKIGLSVCPLPENITTFLREHAEDIKSIQARTQGNDLSPVDAIAAGDEANENAALALDQGEQTDTKTSQTFMKDFQKCLSLISDDSAFWKNALRDIVAFGPQRNGPNMLIDSTPAQICHRFFAVKQNGSQDIATSSSTQDLVSKVTHAFELACQQGPLCSEPLYGVAVTLESFSVEDDSHTGTELDHEAQNVGRFTGEVLKSVRDAIRQGFLDWSPRIMLAMYSCEIQASAEVLGRVYGVITRRRGRIISEVLLEPSPNFTITAVLPVAESFGFSDEIRKRTSGAASPQLVFQGYEMLDEDPFWIPTTEEELEDLGELGDRENVAKKYVDAVRVRKGLAVKKKVVEHGEKQKTLKR